MRQDDVNALLCTLGLMCAAIIIYFWAYTDYPVQWENRDNLIVRVKNSEGLNGYYKLVPVEKITSYPNAEATAEIK